MLVLVMICKSRAIEKKTLEAKTNSGVNELTLNFLIVLSSRLQKKEFLKCWLCLCWYKMCHSLLQHPIPLDDSLSLCAHCGWIFVARLPKKHTSKPGIIAVRAFCHHQCSLLPHPNSSYGSVVCAFTDVCEFFFCFFFGCFLGVWENEMKNRAI